MEPAMNQQLTAESSMPDLASAADLNGPLCRGVVQPVKYVSLRIHLQDGRRTVRISALRPLIFRLAWLGGRHVDRPSSHRRHRRPKHGRGPTDHDSAICFLAADALGPTIQCRRRCDRVPACPRAVCFDSRSTRRLVGSVVLFAAQKVGP
jgi:hypothetical protein